MVAPMPISRLKYTHSMRVNYNGPRAHFFYAWAAVRWLLLMFVIAPVVQAPALAESVVPPKPLKVWQGIASWYGPRFNGRPTAYGETYNMNALTAAHTSLPNGALVRVTCLRTGRSRVIRINDRGPYIPGREIDLSFGSASALGMAEMGISRVRIELLEVPKGHRPPKHAAD
jgi:rare lipoprotein A (peptidoglycan hydrolase)